MINRLGHAFPRTRNIFTNGALIQRSIQLAASWCDVLLGKLQINIFFAPCLSHMCRALPTANLQIYIFRTCAMRTKVASVSSSTKASATLRKNQKDCVCLLLLFHKWKNPELLRGYPYFRNALLILLIFQNKYGRAVTVGMYVNIKTRSLNTEDWVQLPN